MVNEHGKVLAVKKIELNTTALSDIPALLDRHGVEFNDVDIANWPEYNKQTPVAQFRKALRQPRFKHPKIFLPPRLPSAKDWRTRAAMPLGA